MTALLNYTDPDRACHSFAHIGSMFANLRDCFPTFADEDVLKWAILYHDVYYIAGDLENEIYSARISTIELRQDHVSEEQLAELASHKYIDNSLNVRKEYGKFTDEQWLHGRKAFLESFLSREFIYLSHYGRIHWEYAARQNMQKELDYVKERLATL